MGEHARSGVSRVLRALGPVAPGHADDGKKRRLLVMALAVVAYVLAARANGGTRDCVLASAALILGLAAMIGQTGRLTKTPRRSHS